MVTRRRDGHAHDHLGGGRSIGEPEPEQGSSTGAPADTSLERESSDSVGGTSSTAAPEQTQVQFWELEPGDCFDLPPERGELDPLITIVSCDAQHDGEVMGTTNDPLIDTFPGVEHVKSIGPAG